MAIFDFMASGRGAIQQVLRLVRSLVGREARPRLDLQCRIERFGSDYGGWDVAVEQLDRESVVYSFGIGEDVSFDLALIRRFGLTVHGFDPTPRSLRWVRQQELPPEFVMHDYGLADRNGLAAFYPPVRTKHVSHSLLPRAGTKDRSITLPVHRLPAIMQDLGHDRLDLLKLDIEGAEFAVIEDLARSAVRPRQILVEFHHRFPGVGMARTRAAVAALRRLGYGLFAVSDRGVEYGFLLGSRPAAMFPR